MLLCVCLAVVPTGSAPPNALTVSIAPAIRTEPVGGDPDDPAVWISRRDFARSRILGTNKVSAKQGGALYVWDMDGKTRQVVRGLDRPNNVDVEYDLRRGGRAVDVAVVTERLRNRLRVFAINPRTGVLKDIAPNGLPVFAGETGEAAAPMGIALYRRPRDGAVFAVVGRKAGPRDGYLWLYRLRSDGAGRLTARKVAAFGAYSGKKEIESIAVDDRRGVVYYSDEGYGVRRYVLGGAGDRIVVKPLPPLPLPPFRGDHEGIALYTSGSERYHADYVICTEQIEKNSAYHVFRRLNDSAAAVEKVAVVRGGADDTDGIEAVPTPLGPRFPKGVLIVMNSGPKNFLVYDWRDIARAIPPRPVGHPARPAARRGK